MLKLNTSMKKKTYLDIVKRNKLRKHGNLPSKGNLLQELCKVM